MRGALTAFPMRRSKRKAWAAIFGALLTFSMISCAQPPAPRQVKPEVPGRDWNALAEQSRGHSPTAEKQEIELPESVKRPAPEQAKAQTPEKQLSKQKVYVRMHNADLVVVLRALARSVNQNIIMNDSVKGNVSVDIENIPWDEAFLGLLRVNSLTWAWEGDLIRVMSVADKETEVRLGMQLEKLRGQNLNRIASKPLVLKILPLRYADPVKLQEKLKDYLTKDEKGQPRGSITVHEHTNALLVNAISDDLKKITEIVREVDKPGRQINIESVIVQTTKQVGMELGIQWGGLYKGGNFALTPGGTNGQQTKNAATGVVQQTYTPQTGVNGISGQGFGVNFPADISPSDLAIGSSSLGLLVGKIGGNILDMQLTALQSQNLLKILSTPSVSTLDNQMAYTTNGEQVPYVSTTSLGGTNVQFVDAVLKLEITPHVISDDYLKLQIVVTNDQVDFTNDVDGNPLIIKKETRTTLICRNGETIVIAGLTQNTATKVNFGVPGLKDVPILGALFKSNADSQDLEDTLIFITPHILPELKSSEQ